MNRSADAKSREIIDFSQKPLKITTYKLFEREHGPVSPAFNPDLLVSWPEAQRGGSLVCSLPTFKMFLYVFDTKNENTSREALGIYVKTLCLIDFMTKIQPEVPHFF